ncbi:voltage-gated chloride channel family protein [[Clostridium] sordellii]|uniref:ClC family H(+)/Cl(-) exchange transporter n=1 Tax=Paraclostridium sordellii TaxID=1505 RepID=UPI0005DCFD6B|nr:ClC family H(+)/Cl(-) exchange transporter [Paeniclostridium sordellii]MBX9180498.1 ClC family H(+)/Cl(-) exchange transporter [Paeniclostridium sordellii]CEO09655.1 voltage-gated chloride channel family protein [[Clostridium] sordellii] [Paeniclostridium sordellii]CEP84564.1 voltage-gated chloride channel family protein [[Clostridium] sordellii] [Paeniclostridium sordellii]
MEKEKTCNLLRHTENLKFKLILESAIIGAIVGLTIVLHRVLLDKLSGLFLNLYTHSKGNLLDTIVLFGLLIISGYIVAIMVKKVPMISGSGIPQVEGILMKKLKGNWLSILVNKFLGGLLALGAGLSLGREGPSVQMGASIGEGFAKIFKRVSIEEKYLITSGASAGLAAAFNAPISGVMFALEEVHKNFSPLVLLSVMSSALMSDFVTKNLLGIGKSLNFVGVKVLDLKYYWLLIILGAIVGVSGVIFNSGILKTQAMFKKSKLSTEIKVIIPFLITGVVGLLAPVLLGGGHGLIMSLGKGSITLKMLLLFLLVKYLLTFVGFGSGIPGGIFFPLLVLGALIGNIFGIVAIGIFDIPSVYMFNFIILAMAANFAAIVKAPITGIILICEMTGSFEHLLSLAIVCVVAYITSDLLKSEPIYESLLERCLQSGNDKFETNISRKSLMEIVVHIGSDVENKKIKEIKWPSNCLIVSIARGGKEIIPCGDTVLLGGDYLTVMADEENVACALDCITDLTSNIKLL